MHKNSIKYENLQNLEKRLQLHIQQLELVPQLQLNLQDIRDSQLPMLVEDLRKQMISKIESAIKGHATASVKAENVEQKVFSIQEVLKKHIPNQEKEKI